jgi:hypothetical protein
MDRKWKARKLDIEVATKVMGHRVVKARTVDLGWKQSSIPPWHIVANIYPDDPVLGDTAADGRVVPLPYYSEEIRTAMLVVGKLSDRFHAVMKTPFVKGGKHICGFTPLGMTGWNGRPDFEAVEETLEIAICKAALLAVRKKKRKTV